MAYTVSVEVHVVTEQACGGCVSTAPGPATGRAVFALWRAWPSPGLIEPSAGDASAAHAHARAGAARSTRPTPSRRL